MDRDKKVIAEALKRFKLLNEYDFYIGEEEEEFIPKGELVTEEPPADDLESELGGGDGSEELPADDLGGDEMPADDLGGEELGGEEMPADDLGGEELPEPEPMGDEPLPEPEPMEDEVELDITQLVQGTEAAKNSADQANQQISGLLSKFEELNASLARMDAINGKIDNLEQEFEKRNPTPEEKLEMRSLNSFPYSLKLTDYWSEKEGNYDAMGGEVNQDKEYVLTQDEVEKDYNPITVKDSFQNTYEDDDQDFNSKKTY